MPVNDRT